MFKHNEGKVKPTRTDIKTPCVGSSAGAVKEVLPREENILTSSCSAIYSKPVKMYRYRRFFTGMLPAHEVLP
jgi:hypothetical protein